MGREGSSSEAHDTSKLDLLDDALRIIGNLRHKSVRTIDTIHPLITLNRDLNNHLVIAGEVFPGTDGLHCPGHGRVDIRRHESARLGYNLADLDLVPNGDDGLGRGADVLGEGNIDGRRNRKILQLAISGYL